MTPRRSPARHAASRTGRAEGRDPYPDRLRRVSERARPESRATLGVSSTTSAPARGRRRRGSSAARDDASRLCLRSTPRSGATRRPAPRAPCAGRPRRPVRPSRPRRRGRRGCVPAHRGSARGSSTADSGGVVARPSRGSCREGPELDSEHGSRSTVKAATSWRAAVRSSVRAAFDADRLRRERRRHDGTSEGTVREIASGLEFPEDRSPCAIDRCLLVEVRRGTLSRASARSGAVARRQHSVWRWSERRSRSAPTGRSSRQQRRGFAWARIGELTIPMEPRGAARADPRLPRRLDPTGSTPKRGRARRSTGSAAAIPSAVLNDIASSDRRRQVLVPPTSARSGGAPSIAAAHCAKADGSSVKRIAYGSTAERSRPSRPRRSRLRRERGAYRASSSRGPEAPWTEPRRRARQSRARRRGDAVSLDSPRPSGSGRTVVVAAIYQWRLLRGLIPAAGACASVSIPDPMATERSARRTGSPRIVATSRARRWGSCFALMAAACRNLPLLRGLRPFSQIAVSRRASIQYAERPAHRVDRDESSQARPGAQSALPQGEAADPTRRSPKVELTQLDADVEGEERERKRSSWEADLRSAPANPRPVEQAEDAAHERMSGAPGVGGASGLRCQLDREDEDAPPR